MTTLDKIKELVKQYHEETKKTLPENKAPVSGKVFDEQELLNGVEAVLDGWWTEGRWNALFEEKLASYLGAEQVMTTSSGSSANLIAIKSLSSIYLGERRIKPGDEVITVAAGFPTTVNPILEIGAVPVFVDVKLGTYNADMDQIRQAITSKTKAIVLAHTLGNPFDLRAIKALCDEHELWLMEDNCDALGAEYDGQRTGTFGDLATISFYPAHQITMGEGGAIIVNNPDLYRTVKSIRDWGRHCWCGTGEDNACGNRFGWKLGCMPFGYDHKYIYSEAGYNLKITDMQAAIGVAQLDKADSFVKKRRENFKYLLEKFQDLSEDLVLPEATENSNPSWFGFTVTLKDPSINRELLSQMLSERGVASRTLFAGNVLKQPYFKRYKYAHRVIGDLANTDAVMERTLWLGVYPGLGKDQLDHIHATFKSVLEELKNQ